MRKIGVITDVHANLPALEAALAAMDAEDCDEIIHTGDTVAIGPFPAECLDLLLSRSDIRLLMGNHDEYVAFGIPKPQPVWMSDDEWAHQHWTHAQLDPSLPGIVKTWPYELDISLGAGFARFCHYALRHDRTGFARAINDPSASDLDDLFSDNAAVVFYGHHHPRSDLSGAARYINPGALGCHTLPEARYAVLRIDDGGTWEVDLRSVPYDRDRLVHAFRVRDAPAASNLLRMFFSIDF